MTFPELVATWNIQLPPSHDDPDYIQHYQRLLALDIQPAVAAVEAHHQLTVTNAHKKAA